MNVQAIKTPIVKPGGDLQKIIKHAVMGLREESVLVITSKIISYCENRFVRKKTAEGKEEKHEICKKEADVYIDPNTSKYNTLLTMKKGILAVNAGVDESNSIHGDYILWPKDPQQSVNQIWRFLRTQFGLQKVGVVIADSRSMPLRWGVVGTCIAHCGFKALSDFRGKADLFGRELKITQINVAEGIAVAAVLEMGESDQQTPLAVVTEVKMIEFCDREPSQRELASERIAPEDDLYYPILGTAVWKKGGAGNW